MNMKPNEFPESTPVPEAKDVPVATEKDRTLGSIRTLLANREIDPADEQIMHDALAFMEAPAGDFQTFKDHSTNVAMVVAGYDMQDLPVPPAIDAMNTDLLELFCQHCIDAAETEVANTHIDQVRLDKMLAFALDAAKELARPTMNRPRLLAAVEELQRRTTHPDF